MTLNRISIKWKLFIFFFLFLLLFIGSDIFIWSTLSGIKNSIMHEKEVTLESLIDNAYSLIVSYYNDAHSGKMTEEEAKKQALNSIAKLRYGKNGYFWINDYDIKMVMHPIKPSLNGKDLANFKDPTGKRIFADFVRIVKEKGEGFERYMWPKPGEKKPSLKLSFVKGFPQWGWIIGTGFYIDDIQKKMTAIGIKMLILIGFAIIIVILLLVLADKVIVRPIRNVASLISDFAENVNKGEGDLTLKFPEKGNDEVSMLVKAFNTLLDALKNIVSEISHTSSTLHNTSDTLSESVRNIIDSSSSLASNTEETSATVEEITSSVEEVARNAQDIAKAAEELAQGSNNVTSGTKKVGERADKVSENSQRVKEAMDELEASILETVNSIKDSKNIAEDAVKFSEEGKAAIENTIAGLERIKERMDELSKVIAKLGKSSEEIGKIIDVISDIADQTNLLALNAAIEAARAGEHGKGFAVVAEEVRKLAERSQQAAGEISTLIRGIQNEVGAAVKSSGEGRKEVEEGTGLAEHAGEIFSQINLSIQKITQMIEVIANNSEREKKGGEIAKELTEVNLEEAKTISELIKQSIDGVVEMGTKIEDVTQKVSYISAATEEQAAAVREVRNAVSIVSDVAQKNAEAAQNLGDESEKLKKYAERLDNLVNRFKI